MINRKEIPQLITSNQLNIPNHSFHKLDNGTDVLLIESGTQEVIKLEFLFKAGKLFEPQKLVSKLANKLMIEGTKKMDSKEISECLDNLGITIRNSSRSYYASFIIYSLSKYVVEVLPILMDIFNEAILSEKEFDLLLLKERESLKVNLQKSDYLASNHFFKALYGDNHPYGYTYEVEDLKSDLLVPIKTFYKNNYSFVDRIVASGKLPNELLNALNSYFGWNKHHEIEHQDFEDIVENNKEIKDGVKDSVQAAIRIGQKMFNKKHPDYFQFKILNTIFGGYFGSRLMTNIREDKGYTYGIYSSYVSMLDGGYFSIATEVGHEYLDDTMHEISMEIQRLRDEYVDLEELEMVKNYMVSKILESLDGPFHASKTISDLWIHGLKTDFLDQYIQSVLNISAEDIQSISNKYLNFDSMYKVIVR